MLLVFCFVFLSMRSGLDQVNMRNVRTTRRSDVSFCPINMPWDEALFLGRRSFQTQNVTAPAPQYKQACWPFHLRFLHPATSERAQIVPLVTECSTSAFRIQHLDSEPHGQRGSVCMKAHCCFVSSHQFAQRGNNIYTRNPLTHRIKR